MHLKPKRAEMLPEVECGLGDVNQQGEGSVCACPPSPARAIAASLTSGLERNRSQERSELLLGSALKASQKITSPSELLQHLAATRLPPG